MSTDYFPRDERSAEDANIEAINTRKRQYEMRLRDKDDYDAEHVDLFAAAVHPENTAFYVPFDEMGESQRVTFTPPAEMGSDANRERANKAEDYSLEVILTRICMGE